MAQKQFALFVTPVASNENWQDIYNGVADAGLGLPGRVLIKKGTKNNFAIVYMKQTTFSQRNQQDLAANRAVRIYQSNRQRYWKAFEYKPAYAKAAHAQKHSATAPQDAAALLQTLSLNNPILPTSPEGSPPTSPREIVVDEQQDEELQDEQLLVQKHRDPSPDQDCEEQEEAGFAINYNANGELNMKRPAKRRIIKRPCSTA
jgi:hypothetical protein